MYAKTVIEEIIRLQALGFTAEETRTHLEENRQIKPCLDTIYRHRKSPVGKEMLEELIRHQERSILKADGTNPALAMKYRDKLIEKMMPQTTINLNRTELDITQRQIIVKAWKPTKDEPAIIRTE